MKRKTALLCTAVILTAITLLCALITHSVSTVSAAEPQLKLTNVYVVDQGYEILTVESAAIAKNKLGDDTVIRLHVYLPPGYAKSKNTFPVLYFLPGFGEDAGELFTPYYRPYLDTALASGDGKDFVMVGVCGRNALGGSFYVNSVATGNWEDFVTEEVIPFIEHRYRIIGNAGTRGLFGFSMGGFGAINIGMRHPGLFRSVFALSPGLFTESGLVDAFKTWDKRFLRAYGAAFAPDLKMEYPYSGIPAFNGTDNDNEIVKKWENGFGNVKQKIAEYQAKKVFIAHLRVVWGNADSYPWIPAGSAYFVNLLKNANIPVESSVFAGGHEISGDVFMNDVIPFFKKNWVFK